MTSLDKPVTPYAGTAGYSGSAASRDAAEGEVEDGTLHVRQKSILDRVRLSGPLGATVAELRDESTGDHHGKTSSALTTLHKAGHIARLVATRGRCHIYVTPEHVAERATSKPGGNRSAGEVREVVKEVPVEVPRPLSAEDATWLDRVEGLVGTREGTLPVSADSLRRLLAIARR